MMLVLFANMFLFGGNALVNAAETTDSAQQTTQVSNEQVVVQQEPTDSEKPVEQAPTEPTQGIPITGNEKQNIDATIGEEQNAADSPVTGTEPVVEKSEAEQPVIPVEEKKETDQPATPSEEKTEMIEPTSSTEDKNETDKLVTPAEGKNETDKLATLAEEKKETDKFVRPVLDMDWDNAESLQKLLVDNKTSFLSMEDVLKAKSSSEQEFLYNQTREGVQKRLNELNKRGKRANDGVLKADVYGKGINWVTTSSPHSSYFTNDQITIFKMHGEVAFCLEAGNPAGFGLNHKVADLSSYIKDGNLRKRLTMISHFGYLGNSDKSPEQYMAAQMMIWEAMGTKFLTIYSGLNYDSRKADIEKLIKEAQKKASFHNQTKTVKVGEKIELVDVNNSLGTVKGIRKPNGINAAIHGNKLVITVDKNAPDNVTIHLDRITIVGAPLVYQSGNYQKIGVLPASDPLDSVLKLKVLKEGDFELTKIDADTKKPLANAKIEVEVGGKKQVITTDKNGKGKIKGITHGTKIVAKEITAPNGYVVNTKPQTITVEANKTVALTFTNKEQLGNAIIVKEDVQTGNKAQGKASLENAVYGLYQADGTKIKEVTLKNYNGKVQAEVKDLKLGKYFWQEQIAPTGYVLDPTKLFFELLYGDQTQTHVVHTTIAKDQVILGNVEGHKFGNKELVATMPNQDVKVPLVGIEITATSQTTDQSYSVVTDENGYYAIKDLPFDDYIMSETKGMEGYKLFTPFAFPVTEHGKTFHYLLEDKIIEQQLKVVKVDAETCETIALADTAFKIWDKLLNEGKGGYVQMVIPNDTEFTDTFITNEKGYFVTTDTLKHGKDRYEIHEIKAPEKYVLNKTPYVFSVTNDTEAIQLINFGNRLAEANVEVFKYDTTTNFDKKTAIAGVEFDLFKKDEKGTTFVGTFKTDKDGKINVNELLVGDYYFQEVKPLAGYLALDKDVPFSVTVDKDGTVIALDVENKRVPPVIGTTAMGKYTNQPKVNPLTKVTITDAVKYNNLIVGKTYTVNGVLMDKEASLKAGKDVPLLVNGKQITSSKVFVAKKADGTIALDFVFDASALAGKETVVFENVYREGRLVASHTDITDEGQTIKIVYPFIHTKATGENGEKQLQALPNQKVIEWVQVGDLIVGQTYKLNVQGYIVPDGVILEGTSAEKIFKADKELMEFLFEFIVDSRKLEGKGLSFAEWLEAEKEPTSDEPDQPKEFEPVAEHNVDLTSEEQTVQFVKVPTPEIPNAPTTPPTPETPTEVKYSAMLPKTGEQTTLSIVLTLLGVTVLFVLGLVVYKKRKA